MKILLTNTQIEERIKELGKQISKDYIGMEITLVVVLKGSFQVASTLSKNLEGKIKIEFTKVQSYEGHESSGNLKIDLDIDQDLTNKNILIIEDIIDTGFTLYNLKKEYIKRGANVKIFTLLNKPERRKSDIEADYIGFTIENKFVVGYGLDDEELYRELPYIGVIE